jgi:hypothetical protein
MLRGSRFTESDRSPDEANTRTPRCATAQRVSESSEASHVAGFRDRVFHGYSYAPTERRLSSA